MKKLLPIVVLATLPLSTSLTLAEEAHHSDKNKEPAVAMAETDKQMQKNMLRMHEQMHKIMDAKNPQERARLLQEHAKMMQDSQHMMQGMTGGRGMMGGGDVKGGKMEAA